MRQLGEPARQARAAALGGNWPALAECADRSFEVRRRILALAPRHVELIDCVRAWGAGANYTGPGGAIVAVCSDERQVDRATAALDRIGARTIVPTVGE